MLLLFSVVAVFVVGYLVEIMLLVVLMIVGNGGSWYSNCYFNLHPLQHPLSSTN